MSVNRPTPRDGAGIEPSVTTQLDLIADMALAPFVRQFANVDGVWFASQSWAAVQRWLTTIVASERFERIMRPVAVWVPGTRGVSFSVR